MRLQIRVCILTDDHGIYHTPTSIQLDGKTMTITLDQRTKAGQKRKEDIREAVFGHRLD